MRCSSTANSETAIMLEKMARSAASLTDSETASLASLAIPSAAQVTRFANRPMARSMERRRYESIAARTLGSLAYRLAVRSGTSFLRAHTAMDVPCAITRASWDLRIFEFSADGTGWQSVALRFVASSRSVMRYVKEVF